MTLVQLSSAVHDGTIVVSISHGLLDQRERWLQKADDAYAY